MRRIVAASFIAAYPFWSHFAVHGDFEELTIPGLFILVVCAAGIAHPKKRLSPGVWLLLGSLVAATLAERLADVSVAHYLPSILVPGLLAFVFARTLLPGRTPLITRFARDVMNHHSEEITRYTRGVTLLWAVVLSILTLEAVLLAVFSRPETWSLFTNGINYLIVVAVFAVELIVRRARLGSQGGLHTFLVKLARTDLRRLG